MANILIQAPFDMPKMDFHHKKRPNEAYLGEVWPEGQKLFRLANVLLFFSPNLSILRILVKNNFLA